MSYAEAIEHLNALGLELAPSPDTPRRKFELEHMRTLAHALGEPQLSFPSILIAGTNGKGSTAATLASICAHAGLRTGLYTSPHLTCVNERIRTNSPRGSTTPQTTFTEIPEADFAALYFHVDDAARQLVATEALPHPPSFFETLTALAFLYFRECKLDIAILEVGLGGRLDATNIVEPVLSIITDIALDHQEYLGSTIAAIAREKAGILRPNGTLITLPQHAEANQAIGEAAVALNVHGINAADYLPGRTAIPGHGIANAATEESASTVSRDFSPGISVPERNGALAPGACLSSDAPGSPSLAASFPHLHPNHYTLNLNNQPLQINSPLRGEHQQRNIALAIAAALELRKQKIYNIPKSAIEAGIANTHWPGRLELLPPNLLLDVAHNPAGAWTLRSAIASLPESQPRTLLFSCLRDKDLTEMAQILFPLFDSTNDRPHDHILLTPIDNPRAATLDQLLAAAQRLDIPAHPTQSPAEALALARSLTPANGLIIATGSVYLIGALRDLALNPTPAVTPQ
ncbi:MAG TPA: bifunctional folylpolyglutamate synthase/dihydrofolate synthase [Acidobacteriaceae bacterium]|nr:bifunctional folylpolyglutamate synthase/dihydrofolate synthase [Acidobacteriaceae bacterium]